MICTTCMRSTSDWYGNAFTLSLIGYTFTCEIAVRHSDWLYKPLPHVEIMRIDCTNELYGIKFSCYV